MLNLRAIIAESNQHQREGEKNINCILLSNQHAALEKVFLCESNQVFCLFNSKLDSAQLDVPMSGKDPEHDLSIPDRQKFAKWLKKLSRNYQDDRKTRIDSNSIELLINEAIESDILFDLYPRAKPVAFVPSALHKLILKKLDSDNLQEVRLGIYKGDILRWLYGQMNALISESDFSKALDDLQIEGLIYTTSDDNHFSSVNASAIAKQTGYHIQ